MAKINRLDQHISVLAVIAIAATGMSAPVLAETGTTTSPDLQLTQTAVAAQCRAAKQQIPVFSQADATSAALRLIAADQQVTLAGSLVDANGFIAINAPVTGYVHAINLKGCGSPTPPPVSSLCRQVVQPPEGLTIRREPLTTSTAVGGVAYLGRVTLTTNPPTVRQGENRDWVQISTPASGWVSNGLFTQPTSNLSYCK